MSVIPWQFNSDGLLDPGTYEATFTQVEASILVQGDDSSKFWDVQWRKELLLRARVLTEQMWSVGIEDIYLDGSFVEDKDHPNDIDGYFDPHLSMYSKDDMEKFEKIVSNLNSLDLHKVWDWDHRSRRPYKGYSKGQLPMWHFYRVEFYPHLGQGTQVTDKHGNDLQFPSAFRQSRTGFKQKGILKIIREAKND